MAPIRIPRQGQGLHRGVRPAASIPTRHHRGAQPVHGASARTRPAHRLQVDTQTDTMLVTQRIHKAVVARNIFDQARGMLAQRFTIDSEEATDRLVDAAHVTGLSLTEVSRAVVTRDTASPATVLLAAPQLPDE